MPYSSPWSETEDGAIRTFYPRHGPQWDGWPEVLPNRTRRAIGARANRLGIVGPERPKAAPRKARQRAYRRRDDVIEPTRPDPMEGYVLACLRAGLTLEEIDRRKHWRTGKAKLILVERWKRERGES